MLLLGLQKWNVKELAEDIYVSTRQFQRLMQPTMDLLLKKC